MNELQQMFRQPKGTHKQMMISFDGVISSEDVVQPLATQVAGHTPGMLKHKDGLVLKPLLKPVQAKTELEFYEGLAAAPHVALSPFVPKFYGTANVSLECYSEVIILEDVVGAFQKPCIMDIKIGRQTWDPYASASKIESEEKKYAECKQELGFCIPGFQVYDAETSQLQKFDKSYGRSLNSKTVLNAFSIFLNLSRKRNARRAMEEYINKLQTIHDILSQQKNIHLYSSSILLIYDCEQLSSDVPVTLWANVHMIDFAHTYTGENHENGHDKNYLEGLKSLMQVLARLKG